MKTWLGYLDSIRGIGALIVVLGHFTLCFANFVPLPPFATMVLHQRFWLSPVVLAVDCDTAVCLFFVLSGFVLSKVFAPYIHVPVATLSGRAIRLFVPGLCACAYGFLMFLLTRHYAPHAYGAQFAHWAVFMKDALISVPLLGYQGLSIFDHVPLLGPYVAPPDSAANEPLWSLSVEWQGSILIFGLMTLRNIDRRLWVTAMVFWV